MKKIILCLIILFLASPVLADITFKNARKPYTPDFHEWVEVYLNTHIETSTDNYFVGASSRTINKKLRFIVYGRYKDTEIGNDWFKNTWSIKEDIIEKQCKIWTAKGYPISLNDFQIDIEKY
ncbi:hypothetical protein ACFLZ2_05500 [Candidatus Margulisiibacteriota bacterium]